jgi:NifB/MoaA-like Fe-S oxidoreductase
MRTHTTAETNQVLDFVLSIQNDFQKRFGVRFVYPTDEWFLVTGREVPTAEAYDDQALMENGLGLVRHFLDDWTAVQQEIRDWTANSQDVYAKNMQPYERITLVTGTLFAPILKEAAELFSELTQVQTEVLAVTNARLGESITVAGLLIADDAISALDSSLTGDLVVFPRVMFDHPDVISLDDLSPQQVASRLNRPVALADTMGDVWDALIGTSKVVFEPEDRKR